MENIISIQNLSFNYPKKKMFKDFSMNIEEGAFLSIVGLNGSGKTTFVRILSGLVRYKGKVIIDQEELTPKSVRNIVKKIGIVLENPNNQFVAETVRAEIAFSLENMREKRNTIFEKIKKIAELIHISDLLEKDPNSLSGGQKQLVALASALVIEPKIIILDEAFTMTDLESKERIYKILTELNEKKHVTIVNVIHDVEDVLYGNQIAVIDKGSLVLHEKVEEALNAEQTFTKLGLNLPFMVDLSIKLKYYNLIENNIYDIDEMVGALWK